MIIPEEQINQIKERTNIVEVIGELVNLKASGHNYKGLCPFHSEKTPSFMVSSQKGIFHCFGCGIGGNVFNFLMKFKGISFPDAVRILGERTGIHIKSYDTGRKYPTTLEVIYQINKRAAQFYEKNLFSSAGKRALDYLKNRSLDLKSINTFHIGYAINSWDSLLNYLRSVGFGAERIEEAGLIVKKKSGSGYYDRFRNRIIFPIQDNIGRIIGFGGRTFDDNNPDIPKYINTAESAVFYKGKYLYGFNDASESIRKEGSLFIVEGYIDVIRMHKEGLRNTVAPLGTALTEDHAAYIIRYARKIFFAFDSDEAGRKAAIRSISIMHKKGLDPLVIRLPSGKDPGDFFDEYTSKDFDLLVDEASSGIDFIINFYVNNKKEYTANEKIIILHSLTAYYQNMNDEIIKLEFEKKLADHMDLEESIIRRELVKFTQNKTVAAAYNRPYKHITSEDSKEKGISTELYLLLLILNNPQLYPKVAGRLDERYFHGKWTRKLWNAINNASKNSDWNSGAVFDYIDDEKYIEYLSGKLIEDALSKNPEDQVKDVILNLKEKRILEQISKINSRLKEAELENDENLTTELMVDKQVYSNELEKIKEFRRSRVSL